MPEGWELVKLSDIAVSELGKTLDKGKNSGTPRNYLCAFNVKWCSFDLSVIKKILLEDEELERYRVRKGDLLICEGGDVGRAAIWESDQDIYYQNALHRVRFEDEISQYFYLYVLQYYKSLGMIDDVSGGVTIKHFTQNSMKKLCFPFPPIAEQKRIVSAIKQWFALIDTLETAKEDLQTSIAQAKSKILDLAIHGKLVPQDPNDEPAIELLKRINPNFTPCDNAHYPFDVPNNWIWTKGLDIFKPMKTTSPLGDTFKYIDIDAI
ncbi:MAG: restriction endonuclease subunit S, partial [Bacteroidales bacterium]|nr:restriction endonuclease subunit S [Bacteroidales bacterium]